MFNVLIFSSLLPPLNTFRRNVLEGNKLELTCSDEETKRRTRKNYGILTVEAAYAIWSP